MCGVAGIDSHILSTGTITTSDTCLGLLSRARGVLPVPLCLRVSVAPVRAASAPVVLEALRTLSKLDASIKVSVSACPSSSPLPPFVRRMVGFRANLDFLRKPTKPLPSVLTHGGCA
jgi:hypothetical protein